MAYHTQIPNLTIDFLAAILTEAELKCYLYVLRRTEGFVAKNAKTATQRKERDWISLSQFEKGIRSGPWVLDLGTGLSLNSIRKALQGLQEKGLVSSYWVCPTCYHDVPADPGAGKVYRCTRCNTLTNREFGPEKLTAKKMVTFLNAYDPEGRTWGFDKETKRFRAEGTGHEKAGHKGAEQSLEVIAGHVRYLDIANEAIAQSEQALGRPLTANQKIEKFYKPVIKMQEAATDFPQEVEKALRKGLEKAVIPREKRMENGKVQMRLHPDPWAYARAILESELGRRNRVKRTQARTVGADPEVERWINTKLREARELNRSADKGMEEARIEARKILSEMLGKRRDFAKLLNSQNIPKEDAIPRADALIRWAFKTGNIDVRGARENSTALRDWYEEWTWPSDLPDRPPKVKK